VLPPRAVKLRDPALVNDRLRELVQRLERPDSAAPLQAEALLHTALLEVHTQAAQRAGHLPSPVDPRIRVAIEALRSHPSSRPSLPEAARTAGLSATHFSRLFRHETGSSFRSFCVQARMDRARSLLADTAFSAVEVAQLLGYVDYRLFARQFARHHGGRSPSAWRSDPSR
jgi:AraC-like DNA-binding protein